MNLSFFNSLDEAYSLFDCPVYIIFSYDHNQSVQWLVKVRLKSWKKGNELSKLVNHVHQEQQLCISLTPEYPLVTFTALSKVNISINEGNPLVYFTFAAMQKEEYPINTRYVLHTLCTVIGVSPEIIHLFNP